VVVVIMVLLILFVFRGSASDYAGRKLVGYSWVTVAGIVLNVAGIVVVLTLDS
jgi:protein-S-isoprenylcysteine O-methyltransferase Ste14